MLEGSLVALVTPFFEDGSIDFTSFCKSVSWQIEQGTKGLVICGSTGESSTLSSLEQEELISLAVKEAKGRIPIIAGTGSNDTRVAVERTLKAKNAGADASLLIFPYYNRPTFEGCLRHLQKVNECNFPFLLYHNPGRTGGRFSPAQLAEFLTIENTIGIKEAAGDVDHCLEVMRLSSKPLFSGDDTLSLPLIASGARGSISIIGNLVPKEWSLFIKYALEGNFTKARELYYFFAPLCKAMFLETNPQCIKYAMSLEGYCKPHMRLPLVVPKEQIRKQIAETYQDFKKKSPSFF